MAYEIFKLPSGGFYSKLHNVDTNHVTKQEKLNKLLKKYSSGPAHPFVSMIIFENQFFVEMMQYIKKEIETYYS